MRVALIVCFGLAGCDQVFDIDPVVESSIDASGFDGVLLDTAGWPTNGNVGPRTCPATGADEDGDGQLDDCDNCPADRGPQDDRDRDGIGDLCDPHPDFAVERLAAFFPFNDPALPGMKITDQGDWAIVSGALRQRGLTTGRTLFVLDGAWNKPTVEVKITSWTHTSTSLQWFLGVRLVDEPAPTTTIPDSVSCRGMFGSERALDLGRTRSGNQIVSTSAPFRLELGKLTLAQSSPRHGAPPLCDGERDDIPPSQGQHLLLLPDATDAARPVVGLFTFAMTADFTSVVVYETIYE